MSAIFNFTSFSYSKRINNAIAYAESPEEIKLIMDGYWPYFDAINLSTALHRLATFYKQLTNQLLLDTPYEEAVKRQLAVINEITKGPIYYQKIVLAAFYCMGDFRPRDYANLTWGFATLGIHHKVLMEVIASNIVRLKCDGFNPQDLSNLAWSFSVQGCIFPDLFQLILKKLSEVKVFYSPTLSFKFLTFQVYCNTHQIKLDWDPKLCAALKLYQDVFQKNKPHSSKTHIQVYEKLKDLSSEHLKNLPNTNMNSNTSASTSSKEKMQETKMQNEYFQIWYYIDSDSATESQLERGSISQHAIEIMGPMSSSSDGQPLAETKLKTSLLEGLGWKYFEIPLEFWEKLDPPAALQFLKEKLPKVFVQEKDVRTLSAGLSAGLSAEELFLSSKDGAEPVFEIEDEVVQKPATRKSKLNPNAVPFVPRD